MAQTPRELAPNTSARHYFGAHLRRMREERGWSQAQLGQRLHVSADLIAKVEKAMRWPTGEFAAACDATLDTGGTLSKLTPLIDIERCQERTAATATAQAVRAAIAQQRSGNPPTVSRPAASSRASVRSGTVQAGDMASTLPGVELTAPPPAWPVDRLLTLPQGKALPATTLTLTDTSSLPASHAAVQPGRVGRFHAAASGLRDLAVVEIPTDEGPAVAVATSPAFGMVSPAYRLDAFTLGILWALCGMDDALLADDAALAESIPKLRRYAELPGSAVGRAVAADLNPLSQMWLGSDFCARYISHRLETATDQPIFWTREQYGEEASTWLLFRHKIDYLRATSGRFTTPTAPANRVFCIPETAVQTSPLAERVLLLLSAAFMESLHIAVHVSADPAYATVEGFVLSPQAQVILANWVRADGLWHVDALDRRTALRRYDDVARGGQADAITAAPHSNQRLQGLAEYLDLNWTWLRRRCTELSTVGIEGMIRPRSRLLSTDGINAACRYLARLT
ncbi:helix-turn-helix domain-containing protein [Couchioplanes caeruleus]|uniref:Transcriptional regulator n=2 Tax=Couchioplanes caeruleus TaxID=56438 RepID=A0A1K0GVI0_9ACTN|nr:helix-turn-helix transcriptional regulator [Couchioplanes caeruleus]OJF15396.1 transcriptional regulator [Couchioplanes caeruleus subsp. caeruleus]ROP33436.1 helix-turn-helix protein [Couchioplanes caeruleus]